MPFVRLPMSLTTAAMLALAATAGAQTQPASTYTLNRDASVVGFTISGSMIFKITENGRFSDIAGTVAYDPGHPADAQVDLTVYTNSLDTQNAEHDTLLKSVDFFDVAHFPTMHFASASARAGTDGGFAMTGDLTIRGITKRLTVPVRFRPDADRPGGVLESTFEIDRTEFGLNGSPRWSGFKVSISKNVQVHLAIATTRDSLGRRER
jgi:polyisoprenoid-binding protein YceI